MTVGDQLPEIDGLVASWLPGSEGEGVADTLFGNAPFTGQLPQTWPSSLSQEPINVGDATYDPQFPFGWGLRTSSARADLRAAARAVGSGRLRALAGAWWLWRGDGSPRHPAALLRQMRRALGGLGGASFSQQEAVLAVARDVAQAQIVQAGGPSGTSSPLVADADQALVGGNPGRALALLTRAAA
jgi:beta-glucosidase